MLVGAGDTGMVVVVLWWIVFGRTSTRRSCSWMREGSESSNGRPSSNATPLVKKVNLRSQGHPDHDEFEKSARLEERILGC